MHKAVWRVIAALAPAAASPRLGGQVSGLRRAVVLTVGGVQMATATQAADCVNTNGWSRVAYPQQTNQIMLAIDPTLPTEVYRLI